ncbi:FCS-Like Zinc finger 17-like [Wolffia australiana]
MIPRSKDGSGAVGLRILIEASSSPDPAKLVAKPPRVRLPATSPPSFLSACRLCHKQLSPLDDVYMYRGDQAFCSDECRCRQMVQDERRELEAAVRARLPTPPRLRAGRRLADPRQRRPILVVA